jgi:hypothetical protein
MPPASNRSCGPSATSEKRKTPATKAAKATTVFGGDRLEDPLIPDT